MPYLLMVIVMSSILVGWTGLFVPGRGYELTGMAYALFMVCLAGSLMFIGGRFRLFALIAMAPITFLMLATLGLSSIFTVPSAVAISGVLFLYYVNIKDGLARNVTYLLGMTCVWCAFVVSGSLTWWTALLAAAYFVTIECSRLLYLKYQQGYVDFKSASMSVLGDFYGMTKEVCPDDYYLNRYIELDHQKSVNK